MNKRIAILNLLQTLSLAVVIYVNYLATSLPINGMTTGALSALYPNYFVPAGFTFSIWGIIYLLLMVYVAGSWKGMQTPLSVQDQSRFVWFMVAAVANVSWILAWHYRMVWLSVAVMVVLLFSLIRLYLATRSAEWFHRLPVSVYLGWITVALIANLTALLVHLNFSVSPLWETIWAMVMMTVAVVLTTLLRFRFNDPWYQLVTLWAIYGIYMKFNSSGLQTASAMQTGSLLLMILVLISLIWPVVQKGTKLSRSN